MTAQSLWLGAQAEVRPYKVEDLLRLAREGRIRIPAFQRPQRWRSEHVIALFESVVQGFPVGTLLFATRDEPAGDVRFGPFFASAPETRDAMVVVDGQQRVTALVGALLHPSPTPRGDVHAIWLDLESQTFVRAAKMPPETWVPLRVLGDSKESLRWMRHWALASEREDLVDQVLSVGKRIREFQLSCAVVPGDDEARLRRMFQRLNTSGVAMKDVEVFAALFGHDGGTDIREAAARIASAGFGEPTDRDVLRCLLCVGGDDPGKDAATIDAETIREMLPRTERAMGAALTFLAVDASIPSLDLLPYRVPLRILARYFDRFPDASTRARTLLRRWVWRGALSGLFATSSEARVRSLQKVVDERSAEHVAQALLREVGAYSVEFDIRDERWSPKNARSRFVATAMLAHGPRRPSDGETITNEDLKEARASDEDGAFESLGKMFVDVGGRANGPLAGRVLIAERVLVDQKKALAALAEADDAVLESYLIPTAAREVLREVMCTADKTARIAGAERFDALRAPLVQAWTDRFLRAQCEPGADDRVSIASLVGALADGGHP